MPVRFPKASGLAANPIAILLCVAFTVSLGGGCATVGSKLAYTPSGRYVVKSKTARFYKRSPVAAHAPDGMLKMGATVKMIKYASDYSHIDSETHGQGWVASSDLQPVEWNSELEPIGSAADISNPSNTPSETNSEERAIPEPQSTPLPDELRPKYRY